MKKNRIIIAGSRSCTEKCYTTFRRVTKILSNLDILPNFKLEIFE